MAEPLTAHLLVFRATLLRNACGTEESPAQAAAGVAAAVMLSAPVSGHSE